MNYFHLFATVSAITICLLPNLSPLNQEQVQNDETKSEYVTAPTETNWRRMMGLVYRPSFDNLKNQVGAESKDENVDYNAVQRDALILSEFTARMHQWPEINSFKSVEAKLKYTKKHQLLETLTVQQHAAAIYKAGQKRDYASARKSFIAMTHSCNVCHHQKKASWSPVVLEP